MTIFLLWYVACAMVSVACTVKLGIVAGVQICHWRAAAVWPVFWLFVAWRCMR